MFADYNTRRAESKLSVRRLGSGISQLTNKTVDFGASDAPMTASRIPPCQRPQFISPLRLRVVLSYNLPDVKTAIKLTPSVLADIFLGKITTWNDSKLTAINKVPAFLLRRSSSYIVRMAAAPPIFLPPTFPK